MERLKNVLEQEKNAAINGFCSKQMLKSIGIGAAVVGGLSLCASLIYSKVKQHKKFHRFIGKVTGGWLPLPKREAE